MVKKSKKKKQKSSELEKEIKLEEVTKVLEKTSEEIINEEEFHEFIKPSTESSAPVLEKIETPQQSSLEQDVGSAPTIQEKKQEEQKKYDTGYVEPNYEDVQREQIRNENLLIKQPSPINMETTRINLSPQINQNFQINPELQELRRQNQGNLEKDYVTKVGEFKETKTHSPIEQQEKKYEIK